MNLVHKTGKTHLYNQLYDDNDDDHNGDDDDDDDITTVWKLLKVVYNQDNDANALQWWRCGLYMMMMMPMLLQRDFRL